MNKNLGMSTKTYAVNSFEISFHSKGTSNLVKSGYVLAFCLLMLQSLNEICSRPELHV